MDETTCFVVLNNLPKFAPLEKEKKINHKFKQSVIYERLLWIKL